VGYGITGLWDFNSLQKRAVLYLVTVRSHCPSGYRGGLWDRKFRPGNHRIFERKLWEHEIPTDRAQPLQKPAGPGRPEHRASKPQIFSKKTLGIGKFRPGNHKSFERKLWEQEIPGVLGRARSAVYDGPELHHGRTNVMNLYIRLELLVQQN